MSDSALIKTAVVTGMHPFEVMGFHQAFRSVGDADCYIQNMQDWICTPRDVRETYDVVVFYNMHMETPGNEPIWWERGFKPAIEELGETEQGIFLLHHAILAFPEWGLWSEIVGINDRSFGYHHDEAVAVHVEKPDHPITQGLTDWEMTDETYTMADAGAGSEILLTTEHPRSMKTIGWTRQYKNSRVFCFESGHDNQTYTNPSFREVLARGISWCAGRI